MRLLAKIYPAPDGNRRSNSHLIASKNGVTGDEPGESAPVNLGRGGQAKRVLLPQMTTFRCSEWSFLIFALQTICFRPHIWRCGDHLPTSPRYNRVANNQCHRWTGTLRAGRPLLSPCYVDPSGQQYSDMTEQYR